MDPQLECGLMAEDMNGVLAQDSLTVGPIFEFPMLFVFCSQMLN